METDKILAEICEELTTKHLAHTILLYGSRANGTANKDSDYDITAFTPRDTVYRDARLYKDTYLDIFLHPENVLKNPTAEHLSLRNSIIICQRNQEASSFLAELDKIFLAGPAPLPADDLATRISWATKMVSRIRREDPEGNYRRVWLLTALLEDYFALRQLWYQGPKKALSWLAQYDTEAHGAFVAALKPNAALEEIEKLALLVVNLK